MYVPGESRRKVAQMLDEQPTRGIDEDMLGETTISALWLHNCGSQLLSLYSSLSCCDGANCRVVRRCGTRQLIFQPASSDERDRADYEDHGSVAVECSDDHDCGPRCSRDPGHSWRPGTDLGQDPEAVLGKSPSDLGTTFRPKVEFRRSE